MSEPASAAAGPIATRLVENVGRALAGKRAAVELSVTALLAGGHLLLEDVPGVGKTTLARALCRSVGLSFARVQFTSDLMPADVLGGSVYDPKEGSFSFRPGPVFTQVLLADEINRATPKTQSALLEAMGERRVSIEGNTHELPAPFFVVATQNPQDFYGTHPLPESQLDRFLLCQSLGYPASDVERRLLEARRGADPVEALLAVVSGAELLAAQAAVDDVRVEAPVIDYLHEIVQQTRASPLLELGASTRAALAYLRAVRAFSLVRGRGYALVDDVKALGVPVLAHRVRIAGARHHPEARRDAERIVQELIDGRPVPV